MSKETVAQEFFLVLKPQMGGCETQKYKRVCGLCIPKITKNSPSLNRNEVAMKLKIEVPKALFLKPSLEAVISIPSDSTSPMVITPEIQSNITETIKQTTGLDLNITVIDPAGSGG